jgi:hypothetical protein
VPLYEQRDQQEQSLFGLDDDYCLPINHRATDALDTSGTEIASVDKAITADNKGYQMLQRMGWTGKGLGKNEDGAALLAHVSKSLCQSQGHIRISRQVATCSHSQLPLREKANR